MTTGLAFGVSGKKSLRKYAAIARASLANLTAYRARIVSIFIFYTLIMFVFTFLWRAIYSESTIAGFTLPQMIWYLCITEVVSYGARSRSFGQVGSDIKSGAIAYQLGRPYNFVWYHFSVSISEIGMGLTLVGALGVLLGFIFAGPIAGYNALGLPMGFLSMLLGVVLYFFMQMSATLTAMWIEDASGVILILNKLIYILGTFIPIEFLPSWLRTATRFLPFSYVAWGPARLTVGFSWELFWQIAPVQVLWLCLFVWLSQFMYRKGMKALEAHGG